jgi:uncharacterized membrane protein YbhN (UPF0104 family)
VKEIRLSDNVLQATRLNISGWRRVMWLLRLLMTFILVAYLLWSVRDDLSTLKLSLSQPIYLLGAFGIACLGALLSAWVWRGLLPPLARESYPRILAHYLWGLFWNNFLPFGIGGDVVRAASLWKSNGRGDLALSSVMMSRLAGLWSVLLLAGMASLYQLGRLGRAQASPLMGMILGAAFLGLVATALLLGAPVGKILDWLPEGWRSWHTRLREYVSMPGVLLWAIGVSVVIQVCAVAVNLLTATALGLHIPAQALFFTIPLVNLAVLLPFSLGGFGVREGAYMALLGLAGIKGVDALCLSLSVYALMILVSGCGALVSRVLFNLEDK